MPRGLPSIVEPFVQLRVPLLFNLRRDPFEKAQHNSNTYYDWLLDRVFVLVPMQVLAGEFLRHLSNTRRASI